MKPTNIKRVLRRTTLWGAMNAMDQEKFIKKLTDQVIKLEARVKEMESKGKNKVRENELKLYQVVYMLGKTNTITAVVVARREEEIESRLDAKHADDVGEVTIVRLSEVKIEGYAISVKVSDE